MCKICEMKEGANCQEPWKCERVSVWIYPHLPENMRKATEADLFDIFGKPIYGTKFLAQSFYKERYETYTLSQLFDLRELRLFLKAGKVYVKDRK